jgi:hypothetical protein
MKKIFLIAALCVIYCSAFLQAQKPETVQYINPTHNSTLNSRSSQIIIRPGGDLDKSNLTKPNLITVNGSENRHYSGRLVLSSDNQTLIFKPDQPFQPKETVTVTLNSGLKDLDGLAIRSFSYQFTVTPLEKPLNAYQYLPGLDPLLAISKAAKNKVQSTPSDTLPPDFPTFEITVTGQPSDGLIFFSPTHFSSGDGYNVIVNNSGEIQYQSKDTKGAPVDFKVLPNGMLSYGRMYEYNQFVGGGPTTFYMMDADYAVVDSFKMENGYTADSHEFQLLPNGHALMLAYDLQPVDMSGIVEGGHPGALVAGSIIQELDTEKNVVFQWRSWDHYQLTDSYQDLTLSMFDAIHINSIELDHDGHFLVSAMALAEITKINRQTGEIIWRMGGRNNQFDFFNEDETHDPIYFMWQHDVRRIDNGNITVFDDGDPDLRPYTRIVEYEIDETAKTAANVWQYRHDPDIYATFMGNAQRLPNGNTLIGWGYASFLGKTAITEVDLEGNVVFELTFDKLLFTSYRAFRFDWNQGQPAAEVMRQLLHSGDPFVFTDSDDTTGVTLFFNALATEGQYNHIILKQYNYGPTYPLFPPYWYSKEPMVMPYKIIMDEHEVNNITNFNLDLLFDVDFFHFQYPDSILVYYRQYAHNAFYALPTEYNYVTREVKATLSKQGDLMGEFIFTQQDFQSMTFPPVLVAPIDSGQVDQTRSVRLEWTPVGYVNKYRLQVSDDNLFSNKIIDEANLTSAVFEVQSPSANTTYYWRVKSENDAGESDWSETWMFQTTAPFITVTVPNGGESWQRGLNHFIEWADIIEDDVVIQLYRNDTFHMLIDTVSSTGGYRWNIPISLGKRSDYKILIKNATDSTIVDMSDQAFSVIDTVESAVPDVNTNHLDFALMQNYPNPFNAKTRISYTIPKPGHVSLILYDLLGKEILTLVDEMQSADRYSVDFDASKLATGIYFYKLKTDENRIQTRKMTIIK